MKEKFDVTPELLRENFIEVYQAAENGRDTNGEIRMFASPARINIIGEHIDYNGGFVFPAAIDRYLYCAIRKRTDTKIIYNDLFFPGTYTFDINDDFKFDKANDYANFLNGILSCMKKRGLTFPCGFEVLVASNVPSAGGISSSSALECGFAWAVSETFGFNISRKDIALMGQQSEHEFMNVNCGIMDQYIIATGKKDTAELLDCAKIEHEYVPLNLGDYRFVVMNTKKQRKLADSKYNERRAQCEQGLAELQAAGLNVPDLCSITPEVFEKNGNAIKDEVIYRRVRHCVTENDRVLRAVAALRADKLEELGQLLYASHNSLRDDYEVTGIELDTLVDVASKQPGCIGARMTGAGFGGCAIALVHKDNTEDFIKNVQAGYSKVVGYEGGFFACSSGDGVREIK
ncbi:galactokinase [Treponema bryantii]|uniref:Galactokinase n=1 Tax=Treponema bryantii TaxID=163 RepID=A0A1I3L7Y0_9SPIR|nr:galactokinase [Treponema bryantii]SFI80827.1 galactokinase [Treponema bryantii]